MFQSALARRSANELWDIFSYLLKLRGTHSVVSSK